jgi:hypothetical protein
MRALRSRLFWLAALTLTVQIAGLAIAPAALCCMSGASEQATMNCCKDAGPGHICPLMKKSGQSPGSGVSLRSCGRAEDQIFTSLLGFLGVPAPSAPSLAAPQVTIVLVAATDNAFTWLAPVESPPPRA